jgi:glycosyltransferase involved in cell wall biosynthesis
MRTRELVILQPYVPGYRAPFFGALVEQLEPEGIRCRVVAPRARGEQGARNDAAAGFLWEVRARERSLSVLGRRLSWASVGGDLIQQADGIIVGLVGESIDAHRALARRATRGQQVGLWGHIGAYTKRANRVDVLVERAMMRHCDHVFAYTESGAATARRAGVPATKVTAVMNSVDTSALSAATADLTPSQVDLFVAKHGLTPGKVVGYVGGLDASKRIDFLADTLDLLWKRDPQVRLLLGGTGAQRALLDSAVRRGQVVMLGHAGPHEKALIGVLASAVLMPGRIGLVAVETLALGLPLLTTDWSQHAPEAEYLTEGISVRTSEHDVGSYVELVLNGIGLPCELRNDWDYPNLAAMVRNFMRGVREMMT